MKKVFSVLSMFVVVCTISIICVLPATQIFAQPAASPNPLENPIATIKAPDTAEAPDTASVNTLTTKWWNKLGTPQYGGTITYQLSSIIPNLDVYTHFLGFFNYYQDTLWNPEWTMDRAKWSFKTAFTPYEYWTGNLAESWEVIDAQTVIIHLKKGVKWQNKAPVNGREFTAEDVVFHYDRQLGTGHGFTEPCAFNISRIRLWDRVTAIDKYSVQFRFKYPSAMGIFGILEQSNQNSFEAREWVELNGPLGSPLRTDSPTRDWKTAVGTGPWILSDYVAGSNLTFDRNPDYFGFDERFPRNRLPYADVFKIAIIPDQATAIAAFRTGKIDIMGDVPWQQAKTLAETNKEVVQGEIPASGQGISIRVDKAPYNDIRVRKALQMAIDRPSIARNYFGGIVPPVPCSLFNPVLTSAGWGFGYEEWPETLKNEYSYNIDEARKLLAEAGYPNGFTTTLVAPANGDLQLAQVIKSQFQEIGVDMTIQTMDPAAFTAFTGAKKHDGLAWDVRGRTGIITSVGIGIGFFSTNDRANSGNVSDPTYDGFVTKFNRATTLDEAKMILKQADQYQQEHHWAIKISPTVSYVIWQPYLKGYSGEVITNGGTGGGWIWARMFVDQDLKKTMGR